MQEGHNEGSPGLQRHQQVKGADVWGSGGKEDASREKYPRNLQGRPDISAEL
jgi:hypothetical protein